MYGLYGFVNTSCVLDILTLGQFFFSTNYSGLSVIFQAQRRHCCLSDCKRGTCWLWTVKIDFKWVTKLSKLEWNHLDSLRKMCVLCLLAWLFLLFLLLFLLSQTIISTSTTTNRNILKSSCPSNHFLSNIPSLLPLFYQPSSRFFLQFQIL